MPIEIPGFVILGPPRTKKTSNRVIQIPQRGAHKCRACGRIPGSPRVLPSEQFVLWEKYAIEQSLRIKAQLRSRGVQLPIQQPVSIEALIYRETNTGDVHGYYQAIADMLQSAGILADDRLIEDWDGSRRLKDAVRPRVEIYLQVLTPIQEELPCPKS